MPRMLGRKPAKFNAAIPHLHNLVTFEEPPADINWYSKMHSWPMLANDQLGDCVPAGALHLVQMRYAYADQVVVFGNNDAVKLYEKWGNYDPNDPSTDGGCVMSDAMAMWVKDGIQLPNGKLDKPDAIAQINHASPEWIRYAMWKFGGVLIGIECPTAWTEEEPGQLFDLPNGLTDIAGGHCMMQCGKEPTALGNEYDSITWGFRSRMTERALKLVVMEAYAVLSKDWLDAAGRDPAGVDWDQAEAAMKNLKEIT